MERRKTIAIFGCGQAGLLARYTLSKQYSVVAFLDNNSELQGSNVDGVPVFNPEEFEFSRVDSVQIASMYEDEIFLQLMLLKVSLDKVEFFRSVAGERSGDVFQKSFWEVLCSILRILFSSEKVERVDGDRIEINIL